MEFENVKRLTIDKHRWYARVEIENTAGATEVYYFSADSGVTDGDGLFFGTEQEYKEAETW